MKRKIHYIFDVILKMTMEVYANEFLPFIGENRKIKKILKTEYQTKKGRIMTLDFLCQLEDNTLLNIEFQYTGPNSDDLDRFFDYNILSQTKFDELCETIIILFKTNKSGQKSRKIGKSKSMHPTFFYLGDIDFMKILNSIDDKVENNINLTSHDEISLLLMCLLPKYKNKFEILKNICNLHKKFELFNKERIDTFEAIIGIEIENFIEKDKQNQLMEVLNMSPQSKEMMENAINHAIKKSVEREKQQIYQQGKEEGIKEGKEEGIKEGKKEGKKEEKEKIAKNLKKYHTPEEISKITGLTLATILKL